MGVMFLGTEQECRALLAALERNCTCARSGDGVIRVLCAGHKALATDQKFLDHLLFARRMADCFRRAEHAPIPLREGNG